MVIATTLKGRNNYLLFVVVCCMLSHCSHLYYFWLGLKQPTVKIKWLISYVVLTNIWEYCYLRLLLAMVIATTFKGCINQVLFVLLTLVQVIVTIYITSGWGWNNPIWRLNQLKYTCCIDSYLRYCYLCLTTMGCWINQLVYVKTTLNVV
jgi:hypothetical protein